MKAIEQYFAVVLFIILCKVVLSFECFAITLYDSANLPQLPGLIKSPFFFSQDSFLALHSFSYVLPSLPHTGSPRLGHCLGHSHPALPWESTVHSWSAGQVGLEHGADRRKDWVEN